jgi:hypothetical protein
MSEEGSGATNLGFFLAGLGMGTIAALLLAPKSRKAAREYIRAWSSCSRAGGRPAAARQRRTNNFSLNSTSRAPRPPIPALAVFACAPIAGHAKTRLIPALGQISRSGVRAQHNAW